MKLWKGDADVSGSERTRDGESENDNEQMQWSDTQWKTCLAMSGVVS